MKAPYKVTITVSDADGKTIQNFEQCELDYESLVATQGAIADALKGLGKAGVELRKQKGNEKS